MSIPKISVVVPVYGVEKYLNECVDSILNQTFKDIEVVLVDDGSRDNCPQIIDEYAKKDNRVVAIHQKNGGYGKAVNNGIEAARGEYIGIIESDDWIEPDMFEKLYSNAVANNSDISKCSFFFYNSQEKKRNVEYESILCKLNLIPEDSFSVEKFPLILAFLPSIWSCLYKSSFIKKQKLLETSSASYQDLPFFIESLCRANSISFVKEYLVHYRQEIDQNSSSVRRDSRLLYIPEQWMKSKDILKKYDMYSISKEVFFYHCFVSCLSGYRLIWWKYKKQYKVLLKALFSDLNFDNSFSFKYFSEEEKKIITAQMNGHLFGGLGLTLKALRRYLFRIHIRKNVVLLQFFGVQFSNKKDDYSFPRPLIRIRL